MITIFSTPRPFIGEFDRLQRDAIRTWTQLEQGCQIILVNDEEDTTKDVSKELGVEFIDCYASNEYGTPLLDDVFRQVKARARYGVLAHVNTDILLFPDFVDVIKDVAIRFEGKDFLLLGRRWNFDVKEPINFDHPGWREELLTRAFLDGSLHGPSGMDYWVFPKTTSLDPPPFCVGRPGMDSWLVFRSRQLGIPVLDATDAITIIHQQHGYPNKRAPYFEIECARNVELAGGRANMLSMRESDWLISADGELLRPPFKYRVLANLSKIATWRQILAVKRWIYRKIAGSSR